MHIHEREGERERGPLLMPDANAYAMADACMCTYVIGAQISVVYRPPSCISAPWNAIIYDPATECALDCCNDVCVNLARILDTQHTPSENTTAQKSHNSYYIYLKSGKGS